ncbi:MAG: response regulator [Opitutae bacterium]|nr:response regulator [Opitutae bacterium]
MKRLLLVEDEADHAELLARALATNADEFTLTTVGSLAAAQAALTRELPDLALVDFHLPDGDGSTLVAAAQGRFPVILLTAYGSERGAVEAIKAGALDYVIKSPESFAELAHVVRRALREWQHVVQRQCAEVALRESEERYRTLIENALEAIFVLQDDAIVFANRAAARLTHLSGQELTGRTIEDFLRPEDCARARSMLRRVAGGEEEAVEEEFNIIRQDGREMLLATNGVRILWAGRPAILAFANDVSARHRAEVERLEMERRLLHSQKLESLGVLAGGIAHDFNNLLTAIYGNIELALLDLAEEDPVRESLHEAARATRKATELTRQMLAYSGRGRFLIKILNLTELVQEMAQLLRVSIAKTATLHLELAPALPCTQVDSAQVQQVIMNLITNASEAIGDRVGSITLRTGVKEFTAGEFDRSRLAEKPEPGRYVYLDVIDTGCGMDETVQQRLFDPFFTTKFTGRGLGMAAVLGIMRGHKGAIIVDSKPGQGSSIRVLFPALADNTSAAAESAVVPVEAPLPRLTGTVLVVDDEESVRQVALNFLTRMGLRVLCAADGQAAVTLFRQHATEIDLVLLDLSMPKMGGPEAFTELQKIRPEVRVVIASGYDEGETGRRLAGQGAVGIIAKPFQLQLFHAEIRRHFVTP